MAGSATDGFGIRIESGVTGDKPIKRESNIKNIKKLNINFTMTEEQKLRLDLYRETKDLQKAKEVYDFVMADGAAPAPVAVAPAGSIANGLYYIFTDGSYTQFDGKSKPEKDVKYIGIYHDGHSFAVALNDLGKYKLVNDIDNCPEESTLYCPCECDALHEWDCVERTKHIQEVGTDIPLADGEYIPALPMVVLMRYYAKRGLNEMLKLAGGTPFDMDEFYWSVTETYSGYAWYVNFTIGTVNTDRYYKFGSYVVRPVAAFNI